MYWDAKTERRKLAECIKCENVSKCRQNSKLILDLNHYDPVFNSPVECTRDHLRVIITVLRCRR